MVCVELTVSLEGLNVMALVTLLSRIHSRCSINGNGKGVISRCGEDGPSGLGIRPSTTCKGSVGKRFHLGLG